jgi:hypothetical protein
MYNIEGYPLSQNMLSPSALCLHGVSSYRKPGFFLLQQYHRALLAISMVPINTAKLGTVLRSHREHGSCSRTIDDCKVASGVGTSNLGCH